MPKQENLFPEVLGIPYAFNFDENVLPSIAVG